MESLMQLYKEHVDTFKWDRATTFGADPEFAFYAVICYLVIIYTVLCTSWLTGIKLSLRIPTAIHNLILAIWSVLMLWGTGYEFISHFLQHGFYQTYCDPVQSVGTPAFNFWAWMFYASKFYEFGDTLLLVLKGKTPMFLHVYHHCVVILTFWWFNDSGTTMQAPLIMANTFVHSFMYVYYFLSSLGIHPWWKKYITKIQIIQFAVDMFWCLPLIVMYWLQMGWYDCHYDIGVLHFGEVVGVSFLYLFGSFYKKSYHGKPKAAKKTQ
jgi:fatty acid elongase 3